MSNMAITEDATRSLLRISIELPKQMMGLAVVWTHKLKLGKPSIVRQPASSYRVNILGPECIFCEKLGKKRVGRKFEKKKTAFLNPARNLALDTVMFLMWLCGSWQERSVSRLLQITEMCRCNRK